MYSGRAERDLLPTGAACWICGLDTDSGEKPPGQSREARSLCQAHVSVIFSAEDPGWERLDAEARREVAEEWVNAMAILARSTGRPQRELFAEITAISRAGADGGQRA